MSHNNGEEEVEEEQKINEAQSKTTPYLVPPHSPKPMWSYHLPLFIVVQVILEIGNQILGNLGVEVFIDDVGVFFR